MLGKYRPSILQGTLQFEVGRPRPTLAMEHPYERHALSILSAMLFVCIGAYLYFVAASILNVMARSEALSHMRAIEGSMGSLEQEYLSLSQHVTRERAEALGLAPISRIDYMHRPGNAAVALDSKHEI